MKVKEQIAEYEATTGGALLTPEIVLQMASELLKEKMQRGISLTSPAMTMEYLQLCLRNQAREIFHVLFLDTRHRVIDGQNMFEDSIDGACDYPRVVAAEALRQNAAVVIVAHNHP